jgi:hypothetical protein
VTEGEIDLRSIEAARWQVRAEHESSTVERASERERELALPLGFRERYGRWVNCDGLESSIESFLKTAHTVVRSQATKGRQDSGRGVTADVPK